ncbi:MAG: LapA family protein [Patescibacteria group bacterium]
MLIFLIIGLLLGALVVIFALQNITTVTVAFLAWQFEGSLALILVLAVVAGILISSLLSVPNVIKKSLQLSKLKKHNANLKDELVNKEKEVSVEKNKLDANNAYIDDLEKNPKV